ncbi:MAG TPA: acyl-CoA dehydrogenase family protein [Polyangia bacterium]|nr:acyl-CoA dehydrogenase family protein [Polyangia bacterium]
MDSLKAASAAAARIGAEVAARHADDVDRNARFPGEAIEEVRREKLLGAFVPRELGGLGLGITELGAMCAALSQHCSSAGMVLAMHHIQVACLVRHGLSSPFFRRYLSELCERQLLIASVTSEVGVGGDTRSSICAVERETGRFRLNKDATTISYGQEADDLLVTCRRAPDAAASDQVLVLLRKGDFVLQRTTAWDTLGMRGTCSPGFKLTSAGPDEQIVPGSFADSSAQTMVPFSHILWSNVWLGIAGAAAARASAFVRAEARKKPGTVPPTALRLAELSNLMMSMRNNVQAVSAECDRLLGSPEGNDALLGLGFALKMNNLKISTSQQTADIVHHALGICGIMGYKNDTPFSVGRHLRDCLSAALMIGNDRILSKSASLLLVYKDDWTS